MEEKLKEAFARVKEDVFTLGNEINDIKSSILDIKSIIISLTKTIESLSEEIAEEKKESYKTSQSFINKFSELDSSIKKTQQNLDKEIENRQKSLKIPFKAYNPTYNPTDTSFIPANQHINPTHNRSVGEIPTDKLLSRVLKRQNLPFSTGNDGVPTNRQTDKQTNQQTDLHTEKPYFKPNLLPKPTIETQEFSHPEAKKDQLDRVSEILSSLDDLKKELRRKFKNLTDQELAVFSKLYELEDQGRETDYRLLATTLSLSESSVRDYIGKITRKGVPIIKTKLNNKKILLSISQELKKIASLDTILRLREL